MAEACKVYTCWLQLLWALAGPVAPPAKPVALPHPMHSSVHLQVCGIQNRGIYSNRVDVHVTGTVVTTKIKG